MNTNDPTQFTLSTEQFAALNMVKARTVRTRISRLGSYFGVNPIKLANGRTAWPPVRVMR